MNILNQRINWLDASKGFAILTVVFFHVLDGLYYSLNYNGEFYKIITLITKGMVLPLFFYISGLFASRWIDKGGVIKKKFGQLYIPYLIWSYVYGIVNVIMSKHLNHPTSISSLWRIIVLPRWHFWFIYYLFICFIILKLLDYFKVHSLFIMLLSIVAAIGLSGFGMRLGVLSNFFQYFVFFYLGYFYKSLSFSTITRCYLTISWLPIFYLYGITFYQKYYMLNCILFFYLGFFSSYIVQDLRNILNNLKVLTYIGKFSMVIYLLHVFFTSFTRIILIRFGINAILIHFVLGSTLGVVMPVVVYFVFQKIKLAKLFFGK